MFESIIDKKIARFLVSGGMQVLGQMLTPTIRLKEGQDPYSPGEPAGFKGVGSTYTCELSYLNLAYASHYRGSGALKSQRDFIPTTRELPLCIIEYEFAAFWVVKA